MHSSGLDMMKLIFLFHMCHSAMDLTRCYKTGVFTFIFAAFLPQSTAEIQILLVLKTNGRYVGILLLVLILVVLLSAACHIASAWLHDL